MTRGEIWWADLGVPFGSESGFRRPVIIVQNDEFTKSRMGTVLVVPLTTNLLLAEAPGNQLIEKHESGLSKDSAAVVSQLCAIDKARLIEKVRKLDGDSVRAIERGLLLVLDIRSRD